MADTTLGTATTQTASEQRPPSRAGSRLGLRKKSTVVEQDKHVFDGGPDWETQEIAYFRSSRGSNVGYRVWTPKEAPVSRVLLMVHGLHEHSGRYAPVAHWFTQKGFAVCAHDHAGHGMTAEDMGYIPDYTIVVDDMVEFTGLMMDRYSAPSLPVHILCHSMGTLVTAASLPRLQQDPKRAPRLGKVLWSGCALHTGSGAAPLGIKALLPLMKKENLMMYVAGKLATWSPRGPGSPIAESALSHDPQVLQRMHRDAYHFCGKVKNKTAHEFLQLRQKAEQALPHITLPSFIAHGTEDSICDPSGSEYLYEHLGSSGKTLKLYPGLYHEILNEAACPEILADFMEFVGRE